MRKRPRQGAQVVRPTSGPAEAYLQCMAKRQRRSPIDPSAVVGQLQGMNLRPPRPASVESIVTSEVWANERAESSAFRSTCAQSDTSRKLLRHASFQSDARDASVRTVVGPIDDTTLTRVRSHSCLGVPVEGGADCAAGLGAADRPTNRSPRPRSQSLDGMYAESYSSRSVRATQGRPLKEGYRQYHRDGAVRAERHLVHAERRHKRTTGNAEGTRLAGKYALRAHDLAMPSVTARGIGKEPLLLEMQRERGAMDLSSSATPDSPDAGVFVPRITHSEWFALPASPRGPVELGSPRSACGKRGGIDFADPAGANAPMPPGHGATKRRRLSFDEASTQGFER
jgi:hypothetical protein